ncbi:MAG TPA: serine/threonine-protein kinase [Candidatus Sulfotelmatobacter sp.]|nr:serine/threonine-protein kinase [Candidatus Sulfotelmatobacter sp.]
MKRCPSCNSAFPIDYTHCPRDGSTLADTLTDSDAWGVGTLVRGKYEILSKVGHGGMGTVYKAMHVRFNELRALKVISAELASDAGFVRRFEQEAVMTRKLQHPNAVRVEDIDHAEDGRPFIVMEYIEGRNLKDVIEQDAPLAVRRVCSIVKQVAAALDAAHALGIVHRDIKPANLALVRAGNVIGFRSEQAKVFDFGIAKLKEDHLGDSKAHHLTYLTLTGTGVVIGTPAYMSPEQAKGLKGDQLDGRSDLYSLGIVAYQLLTGDLPLKADSTVELLIAHISTAPKPLHDSWPELEIPDEVATVVMRCLEKDRDLRPASGQALIADLTLAEDSGLRVRAQATATSPNRVASSDVKPEAPASDVKPEIPALKATHSKTARTRLWAWTAAAALVIAASAGNWWYVRKEHRAMGQEDRPIASTNARPEPSPSKPPKPDAGGGPAIPSVPSTGRVSSSRTPSVSPPASSVSSNATPVSNHESGGVSSTGIKPQSTAVPGQESAGTTGRNTVVPDSQRTLPPTTPAAEIEPLPGPSKSVAEPTPSVPLPSSENVGERGKAWLDAQKDSPAINVTGAWNSEEWGDLRLIQTQGSRDVSGNASGYELTGVVSGKRLFLLFHNGKGKVDYCATLDTEADNKLSGGYSDRVTRLRFGHGLCQQKSRPMHIIKK